MRLNGIARCARLKFDRVRGDDASRSSAAPAHEDADRGDALARVANGARKEDDGAAAYARACDNVVDTRSRRS